MRSSLNIELPNPLRRRLLIISASVFLLAFGVRLLTWHDTRFEAGKVQSSVTADYQRVANLLSVLLSVVPLYFFTIQSAFHTEYRYVLAVNYFLFAFAAVALAWIARFGYDKLNGLSVWERVRAKAK